ncbi:PP2C family protein-serine/threonine phosphatase [Streptomyces endophyticus]|uniref:Serine/threonine-protein phosphatase n=1 Tax=Streptomyces endophyticus TaxID=714166 RepID=A0ABU6FI07_9ACTN|nr:PP2C family protein-serine/threonine phosphatase [Streptomyces endophyticus]MEB8343563.1 serine/threonine-protein phosphatase [Streptomyces endophyticus]
MLWVSLLGLCAALAACAGAWQPARPAVAILLIGPVLACTRLGARATLATAAWALALAVAVGIVRHADVGPQLVVEYLVLLVGGLAAVRIARGAAARSSRLRQLGEVAQATQAALLRPVDARFGDINVHTRHHCAVASATVGGDVYAVADTPYGLRVFIGDVRGHGLDAMCVNAAAADGFRDLAYVTPDLTELAVRLDARIAPVLGPEDFVTAVFAEFAPGEVRLVNCGHPPPLRMGVHPKFLSPVACSLPLGLGCEPTQSRYWLQSGDRLLLYTDGLVEARDAAGGEFPLFERAREALAHALPWEALDRLYGEVAAHTGGPLRDDVALVLCESGAHAGPPVFEGWGSGPRAGGAACQRPRGSAPDPAAQSPQGL